MSEATVRGMNEWMDDKHLRNHIQQLVDNHTIMPVCRQAGNHTVILSDGTLNLWDNSYGKIMSPGAVG
ncbi:MAG: hypothetical protein IIB45_12210 [Candidatus Marinimicrobia bacterium]|nr:hypothetical protein [Candidatus Neomarinimicrobiota bacterium]